MPKVDYADSFTIDPESLKILDLYGVPVGSRMEFYSQEKKIPIQVSRNPFPTELDQMKGQHPKSLASQQEILSRLKAHIRAVIEFIPESRRVGSSAYWGRQVTIE